MASILLRSTLFVIFTISAFGDEIEVEVQSNSILKMLREMVNQTAAEALNLPANATSIRENITDTFSCENRTYGYYADVDNECQLFHICVPRQMPSGHNITFKYSMICPKETVFNQEVLVCTWPRESIPCEESPNFYDLNMEIGKIVDPDINKEEMDTNINKQTENVPVKENLNNRKQNRNQNRKKQNIIMDALLQQAEEQMGLINDFNEKLIDIRTETETDIDKDQNEHIKTIDTVQQPELLSELSENKPTLTSGVPQNSSLVSSEISPYKTEMKIEPVQYPGDTAEPSEYSVITPESKDEYENSRLGAERSSKRTGRKIWRGSKKFNVV